MGPPSVGDVVIIPFPYSYLTQSKCRPALPLNEALILGVAGHLTHSKLSEVIGQLVEMLSACLRDDTF
jgi:hypothetical protein